MNRYMTLFNRITFCYAVEIIDKHASISKAVNLNNKIWQDAKNIFYGKT